MTANAEYEGRRSNTLMLLAAIFAGLLLALIAMASMSVPEAQAVVNRKAVGPTGANGFPVWYQDAGGRRLELCLDGPPLCLAAPGDLVAPDGEAFYWDADAAMANVGVGGGGTARLTLAVEAAFASANPDSQIAFGRIRVRADNLKPNTTYKVTHPYGARKVTTDSGGELRISQDIGAAPHRFGRALRSPVFQSFLRWDPNAGRAAPAGFLGNPNINHKVVGSPNGTNFFRIEGPNVGGRGKDVKATSFFSVQGKRR